MRGWNKSLGSCSVCTRSNNLSISNLGYKSFSKLQLHHVFIRRRFLGLFSPSLSIFVGLFLCLSIFISKSVCLSLPPHFLSFPLLVLFFILFWLYLLFFSGEKKFSLQFSHSMVTRKFFYPCVLYSWAGRKFLSYCLSVLFSVLLFFIPYVCPLGHAGAKKRANFAGSKKGWKPAKKSAKRLTFDPKFLHLVGPGSWQALSLFSASVSLWFRTAMNRGVSTEPLAGPFVRSLAQFTHSLLRQWMI